MKLAIVTALDSTGQFNDKPSKFLQTVFLLSPLKQYDGNFPLCESSGVLTRRRILPRGDKSN